MRSSSRLGFPTGALVFGTLLVATGCGAVLTGGVAGALFATGGNKGGGGAPNQASKVDAASVTGDTSLGTVTFNVTISDSESDQVKAEVRYSTDPNENASKPFAKIATGTFSAAGVASGTGSIQNGSSVATSPQGTQHVFGWNTAQDLGATRTENVRLQIVIANDVGFTVSPFTVDNTGVPLVVSATPGALPAGATVYSDDQNNFQGFIPISIVLAQSESKPVDLTVSLSTDGGATYPNAAVGRLINGSGAEVSFTAVPTSQAGTLYTFRFLSASSGLGASSDQVVRVRFVAKSTKTGAPRDTSQFAVNNASFSASVLTPARTAISDKVNLTYVLFDAARDPLDITVQISPSGAGGPYSTATEVPRSPSEGTTNLSSATTGKEHHFLWNAFFDMIVRGPTVTPASFNSSVQLMVTKRKTQVTRGPFRATTFPVDQRLIETVFNRGVGSDTDVPSTSVVVNQPEVMAQFGQKLYVAERFGNNSIVRAVDFAGAGTPTVETFLGGGQETDDGNLAEDFGVYYVYSMAASRAGSGALIFAGILSNFDYGLFRVDGATPFVTSLTRIVNGVTPTSTSQAYANLVTVEPLDDLCYYYGYFPAVTPSGRFELHSISTVGRNDTAIAGSDAANFVRLGENVPRQRDMLNSNFYGIAANFKLVPNLVFYLIDATNYSGGGAAGSAVTTYNVRAINVSGAPVSFGGFTVNANCVATVVTNVQATVRAISVNASNSIDLALEDKHQIVRVSGVDGTRTPVAGAGAPGFAGDGDLATSARLVNPRGLCSDGLGSATPGGFFVADTGNGRVRRVRNGNIATVLGTTPEVNDGQPGPIARLQGACGIAPLPSAILIADTFNSRVRMVDDVTLAISTVAGTGESTIPVDSKVATNQPLSTPTGIARRGVSDIFVSLAIDNAIELLSLNNNGKYETTRIAGRLDGVAGVSSSSIDSRSQPLSNPKGIDYFDGLLVVCESAAAPARGYLTAINVSSVTTTHWGVTIPARGMARIAGGGTSPVLSQSRTAALTCQLGDPTSVCIGKDGTLYVADAFLNEVLELDEAGTGLRVIGGNKALSNYQDDVQAIDTNLAAPVGVALERGQERILYVYERFYGRIRGIRVGGAAGTITVQNVPFNATGLLRTIVGPINNPTDNRDGIPGRQTYVGTFNFQNGVTMLERGGQLYYPDFNGNRIRVVSDQGIVTTVAGTDANDNGDSLAGFPPKTAEAVALVRPTAIAVAPDGRFYVMDSGRVRAVAVDSTFVTRIAGTSASASSGDGVPALQASFGYRKGFSQDGDVLENLGNTITNNNPSTQGQPNGPRQIALSTTGFVSSLLAVADTLGQRVAVVNLGTTVQPLSGMPNLQAGELRVVPFPALTQPEGVAFTTSGLVLASDVAQNKLIAYNASATAVTCRGILINPGSSATIVNAGADNCSKPRDVLFDARTNLIIYAQEASGGGASIVNALNPTALPITAFGVTIAAGSITQINAFSPTLITGMGLDPTTGDVYVADPRRHQIYVKHSSDGSETSFAGSGLQGFDGDGGIATSARMKFPQGVGVDAFGSVYVLDTGNYRVRRCRPFP